MNREGGGACLTSRSPCSQPLLAQRHNLYYWQRRAAACSLATMVPIDCRLVTYWTVYEAKRRIDRLLSA